MRLGVGVLVLIVAASGLAARADGDSAAAKGPVAAGTSKPQDRERAALDFVRENHPELAQLLEQLKPMKPEEYRRAMRDIEAVTKTLGALKQRDPKRYELGLGLWKSRSRVELLTARLMSAPSTELETQLRQAVAHQLEAEIRQQKYERDQTEARLKRLNANIDRLESDQDTIVAKRFQQLRKQSERNRRRDRDKTVPRAPAQAKKEGS